VLLPHSSEAVVRSVTIAHMLSVPSNKRVFCTHFDSVIVGLKTIQLKLLQVVLSATHHLISGINFLTHFVSHVLICLFLIHLFSTVISPPEYHRHHSYHPSPRHSSIPNSKLSYFSNPTLHRHLAPLRTDFTDTRAALRLFFSVSALFLVSVIVISFRLSFSVFGLLSLT